MAEYGEIELGDRVRAKIDKFEGIASGITEYLHQCRQVLVSSEKTTNDGGHIAGVWIDEPWLEITKKGVHKPDGVTHELVGGKQRVKSGAPNREHPPTHR